ncbi:hypothetical protein JRQ81_007316 [Phrynocephalus forsythii]|uniref:Uncharacterized protein n=1 Tax=Phrynocephalus forsythii TaxID=171643 RepID=A0A9Q1AU09_9SAUR|nr:hypothetical protein JRQ81_007316 [Phrynocephalus forsythii]
MPAPVYSEVNSMGFYGAYSQQSSQDSESRHLWEPKLTSLRFTIILRASSNATRHPATPPISPIRRSPPLTRRQRDAAAAAAAAAAAKTRPWAAEPKAPSWRPSCAKQKQQQQQQQQRRRSVRLLKSAFFDAADATTTATARISI